MERMKILFYGTDRSSTENHTIEAYVNSFEEIFIQIQDTDTMDSYPYNGQAICLNRETAIKLVKELKKAIGQLN